MKKKISFLTSLFTFILLLSLCIVTYANDSIDSNNTDIVINKSSYKYSGQQITPAVKVYFNSKKLNLNEDYTCKYSNNINAGKATITIEGIGNYNGTLQKNFEIEPIKIKKKDLIIKIKEFNNIHTGNYKKPKTIISYKKKIISPNMYTISYSNNKNVGTAKLTVTGNKNYVFKASKEFKILPKSVKKLNYSSTENSITLKWKKVPNVTGYKLYKYDYPSKAWKYYKTISAKSNSYTVKNLKNAEDQSYRIRTYKKVNNKNYYGEYSNLVKTASLPAQIKITYVEKKSNKINVEWSAVKCSSYKIIYSTDPKFEKNVKSISINNRNRNKYTIKNINKNKTYYIKIRAIYNRNDKLLYGKYSSKLSTYYSNIYSSYSTKYVKNKNRTTNLKVASKAINGTIVMPGETFSFNKVVGERTSAKGYKSAPIFSGGSVIDGTGGGICQVASTMFNCALLANVQIVERHQHSQRVAYVPLGRDAAIMWGSMDLKWKNNTDYPIRIEMKVKDGSLYCKFYTCLNKKPKKVKLDVKSSNGTFTLTRTVNGKRNYKTKSSY